MYVCIHTYTTYIHAAGEPMKFMPSEPGKPVCMYVCIHTLHTYTLQVSQ